MSTALKKSMNLYYDERANEYDEIYTLGAGPASITDPNVYKQDVIKVKESIKKQNFKGVVFDVPCGTAFWMPSYYQNAEKIVLMDQSANMLKKAKERSVALDCLPKCQFIKLNNGVTFNIYKKYFTAGDLKEIAKRESLHINIEYFGKAFFIATLSLVY